jgi:hypothetical protein
MNTNEKTPGIDIMLDIETLGTKPGSIILSIGAVRFDVKGVHDTFYHKIHPATAEEVGLQMDAATVVWWMAQSEEARKEAFSGCFALVDMLIEFNAWVTRSCSQAKGPARMWGNGAAFDNVLLRAAYEACHLEGPWQHWNDRCYRTVKNLFPQVPKPAPQGVRHHALDDAKNQARHMIEIIKYINFID